MEEMFYIAEETALVEGMDFSCVTMDQFELFIKMYHQFEVYIPKKQRQSGLIGSSGLHTDEIHPIQKLNKRDIKILGKNIKQIDKETPQTETICIGSQGEVTVPEMPDLPDPSCTPIPRKDRPIIAGK